MQGLDWNDLRLILAIARTGSLAGAARQLGINHSTVFRRLNACEQAMGVRVFDRLPEGYIASAAGEEVLRHAESAEQAVLGLERAVSGRDFRLSGRLRVTTAPALATDYLAAYVADFRTQYPEIEIEIAVGDRDYDLARREADVALRASTQPPDYLVGTRVLGLRWHVYAGEAYLARRDPPLSTAELNGHDLIGADPSLLRLPVFGWMEKHIDASCIVARSNHLDTMAALAAAGLGLALLPGDQHKPALRRLFTLDPPFEAGLWLLTHPDLRNLARVKAFMHFLRERLRADPRLRDA